MDPKILKLIIVLLIISLVAVLYVHLTEVSSLKNKYENMLIELESQFGNIIVELNQERSQNVIRAEIIKNLTDQQNELIRENERLKTEYQILTEKYNNLSFRLNDTLRIVEELNTNQTKQQEWMIFKNLSEWFRENSEYPDPYLRSKILRECGDGRNLKIPCAVYITRTEYGYNNRVSEFSTLKKFVKDGYGDCKQHALMLRELLRSLNPNIYLEGTRAVSILDSPYYNYVVYQDVVLRGYTSQLFARVSEYDFAVVCFNTERSGHCGVAISSVPISSYKNLSWGYVIDPLTGITLGDLGGKYRICESQECFREPNRILMVIHEKWIDYFDGQIWRRLE